MPLVTKPIIPEKGLNRAVIFLKNPFYAKFVSIFQISKYIHHEFFGAAIEFSDNLKREMMVEDCVMIHEYVWEYFSGKNGSKSEYFRENAWPIVILFSILITGAFCNVFLVSILVNLNRNFLDVLSFEHVFRYVA